MSETTTTTDENTKKEIFLDKIKNLFKKIWNIVLPWFKSVYKWFILAGSTVLSIVIFKKIDHIIQEHDSEKKQKAKENASSTSDKIEESKTKTSDIKSDIETAKEKLSEDKNEIKESNESYKENQEKIATEAGFTKD